MTTEHVRMTRAERRAETRERLMAAAAEVFAERGIAGGSVEVICERAGFTRGAFYSNFESKDELCLAMLRSTQDAAIAMINASLDEPATDDLDAVGAVLAAFVTRMPVAPHELMLHQELELYAQRDTGFRPAYREFVVQAHRQIAELLTTAVVDKGCRLVVGVDLAVSLLEEQFIRCRRLAVIFEDPDGGQQRLRDGLTQTMGLVSEEIG